MIDTPKLRELYGKLHTDPDYRPKREDVREYLEALPIDGVDELLSASSGLRWQYYAEQRGLVVSGARRAESPESLADDDGSDLYSGIVAGQAIELSDHLEHVRSHVASALRRLPLASFTRTLLGSAEMHDWGKADPRFQALLLGGDLYSALWETRLYAKSARIPSSLQEYEFARSLAELPKSFRHELLSMALIDADESTCADVEDPGLLLHLVASHHGHARPWAPVCDDPEPPDVSLEALRLPQISLSQVDRQGSVHHRIDSPIIERFWSMTRRYGWWGVAFLESVLRLADRRASQFESALQANRACQDSLATRETVEVKP